MWYKLGSGSDREWRKGWGWRVQSFHCPVRSLTTDGEINSIASKNDTFFPIAVHLTVSPKVKQATLQNKIITMGLDKMAQTHRFQHTTTLIINGGVKIVALLVALFSMTFKH